MKGDKLIRRLKLKTLAKLKEETIMKRTNDIVVAANMIGGRQGWAYICNSGEVTVLKADLEKKQEYDDYKIYGKVKAADRRGLPHTCELVYNECDGKSRYELSSGGCCLSASFGYRDAMELIEEAGLQTVQKDDIVAVAEYTSKTVMLKLFKISSVDIFCTTAAHFIPLTDEEMQEVVRNANRWCNR